MPSASPDMRPSGADNYLKWRRSIDEHLELRRLSWNEYAMFNWLCTKANPRSGTLRTSWPTLAEQTGLTVNHVQKFCSSLKRKRYIGYPAHRGRRAGLVEVAIDKFPLTDGSYTALAARVGGSQAEVPAELLAEPPAEVAADLLVKVPAELSPENAETTGTFPDGRNRKRIEKEKDSLRVRSADTIHPGKFLISKAEALAQMPPALRTTLEIYCFKTGREVLDRGDLECLPYLGEFHTPAVIQKAITAAVGRFEQRGQNPAALSFRYLWACLRHHTTRTPQRTGRQANTIPNYPPGVTRLW